MRRLSQFDRILGEIDTALRTISPPKTRQTVRSSPADTQKETSLTATEKRQIAGFMRVNHAGEVCAQALYQGQAWGAKTTALKAHMAKAAEEEIDHLGWCEARLNALDAHSSLLNPFWYIGSFFMGAIASAL